MNGWYIHTDLGHQAPQIYKQCLCSILMTGLMSQTWTTGSRYTPIYTTACLPPARMGWSQINPGPQAGTWMPCVPSAVHPLWWAGADGCELTHPKALGTYFSAVLDDLRQHGIEGIRLLSTCFETSQEGKPCFSSNDTGWRKVLHMVMLHRFQISSTQWWFKYSSCNTPFAPRPINVSGYLSWLTLPMITKLHMEELVGRKYLLSWSFLMVVLKGFFKSHTYMSQVPHKCLGTVFTIFLPTQNRAVKALNSADEVKNPQVFGLHC